MHSHVYPTLTLFPDGPNRLRLELHLSERYLLIGDYVCGVLLDVTLKRLPELRQIGETTQKDK